MATRRKQTAEKAEDKVEEVSTDTAEAQVNPSNEIVLVGPKRYVCVSLNGGAPIERGGKVQVDDDEERERLLDMTFLSKFNQDVPYFIPSDQYGAWKDRSKIKSRIGGDLSLRGMRGMGR